MLCSVAITGSGSKTKINLMLAFAVLYTLALCAYDSKSFFRVTASLQPKKLFSVAGLALASYGKQIGDSNATKENHSVR